MMFNAYPALKVVHASCAMLTLMLFIWRGRLSLQGRSIPRRWLRWVPDSVDTVLLSTGIALVFVTGQYPFEVDWITVKLIAVVTYIGLGFIALRFGRTLRVRRVAWAGALLVFSYIVLLAHFKQILPIVM